MPTQHSPRLRIVEQIRQARDRSQVVIVTGDRGSGQKSAVAAVGPPSAAWTSTSANGNWLTAGYLSGFQELLDAALAWCSEHDPRLISRYEQSLKRILPRYESPHFRIPKDLTNTSGPDERTRFYHHEYQNKLLVGVSEFLLAYLIASGNPTVLQIDDASAMSHTANSLLRILLRAPASPARLKFMLIDYDGGLQLPRADTVHCPAHDYAELDALLGLEKALTRERARVLFATSRGDERIAAALLTCAAAGVPAVGYLDPRAMADLYLGTLDRSVREERARRFIAEGCQSDDYLERRNYETLDPHFTDAEHERHHAACMAAYERGEAPLVTVHARAIRDKYRRLSALVRPTEILKNIGLYDTLFSYFGELFADRDLRNYGSGDDPENALFINAAFILYSLGCGRVSSPFLEDFRATFPHSKYLPTVLYAQSMTYGRYLQPVDLPRAEQYARANIETIEARFQGYDKYDYISVFAENAYAYIKARQGRFDEALALCSNGNERMLRVYGPDRFRLHQSILIYNTSQVYELVKDFARAETQLRLAIAYDPCYGEYYNDLGNLLAKVPGRAEDALAAYATAIDLCPPYHEAHLNRGLLQAALGRADAALEDFRRVLEIKPDDWRALFETGNLYLVRGDCAQALAQYRSAEAIDPASADLQCNIGFACSELGRTDASIVHYRDAITLNPGNAAAHNNLAIELFQMGFRAEAVEHAALAATLSGDPDYERNRVLFAAC